MPAYQINGLTVHFPFEPYSVQHDYMTKVIQCLQTSTHGILESPTGTGKTLSLLCSSLAWLELKKAQVQASANVNLHELKEFAHIKQSTGNGSQPDNSLLQTLEAVAGENGYKHGVPRLIYASRTHAQIAQAMQELKRTNYNYMKASVVGSREQLCIHPDVMKETTAANKRQLCKLKTETRTCGFYHRVEKEKNNPLFAKPILDIEDLVKDGRSLRCCPYYLSKELMQTADIVFMPYNYLLDSKIRMANKIELDNTVVILDEAHNVEKMCEDSASVQVKSTEIALCIEEVTTVFKMLEENHSADVEMSDTRDFAVEDLVFLKEILLELEKVIDKIDIPNVAEGRTFPGAYIFDLLGQAKVNKVNAEIITALAEKLVQFLSTVDKNTAAAFRKGAGLSKLAELLNNVYGFSAGQADYCERVAQCFRVHVGVEEPKNYQKSTKKNDQWLTKASTKKNSAKIVSCWCFSPSFSMQQLMRKNVRSIILTSGTLAPLKPLINELGIPIAIQLENPHIVNASQICVKIVSEGPDKEMLNSNFENRNNPKYITSLGRTILSFCPIVPHGMLVFFPSYPVMNACIESWQTSGLWSSITERKPIFVEPRTKDAFNETMVNYYAQINDPSTRGAIFMAVCRGKVSEGLDFADMNGRAVLLTGLPFPPLKDPRVILKKSYLEENRTRENGMLSGNEWYRLEAIRAVNQAIGRVIRHKDDYGAILLCDTRFNNPTDKNQLSKWIQGHLKTGNHMSFGPIIGEVCRFFRTAERTLPQPQLGLQCKVEPAIVGPTKELNHNLLLRNASGSVKIYEKPVDYTQLFGNANQSTNKSTAGSFMEHLDTTVSAINFNENHRITKSATTVSTSAMPSISKPLKRKHVLITNEEYDKQNALKQPAVPADRAELLKLIRSKVAIESYKLFLTGLAEYKREDCLDKLLLMLNTVFHEPNLRFLWVAMQRFIKPMHKEKFDEHLRSYQ